MKKLHFYSAFIICTLILSFYGNAQSFIIRDEVKDPLAATVEVKDASGEDINDAFIRLKISGGKGPYKIHCFSPYTLPTESIGNELNLEKIKSGDYLFVIQDSGGKSIAKEVKISINK